MCVCAAGALATWAYFTSTGAAAGTATVGRLSAPAQVTATIPDSSVRSVRVAWTAAPSPDGTSLKGYTVQRSDGSTATAACGTAAAPLAATATTCDDTGVPSATYTYTVTALWKSWTAASAASPPVTVAASALGSFRLAASTSTPTAGVQFSVTITAVDQYGTTFAGYTGGHCLVFSGPHESPTGVHPVYPDSGTACSAGSSQAGFTSGVASVAVTLFDAETATLVATEATTSATGSVPLTVGAAPASQFTVSTPVSGTAGTAFPFTISARDAYGNGAAYSGAKSLAWSGPGAAPNGTAPSYPANPVSFTAGAATVAVTLFKAESVAVTVTDGSISGSSGVFTVAPAAAAGLAFTTQPTTTNGGAVITPSPAVAVQDAYANRVTSDASSVTVAIGTNPSAGTLSGTTTVAASSGVATFGALSIDKAGTGYTLRATDGSLAAATSAGFNITVGPANKLAFTTQPSGATSAGATGIFPTQPAVTVQDAGGNTVTSYVTPVTLALGTNPTGAALTCAANPVVPVSGVAGFTGCSLSKTGNGYTLVATSGTLAAATSNPFNVTGSATKLAFTTQPGGGVSATAWAQQPVVAAQDANGNVVTAYPASSVAVAITSGTGASGAVLTCTPSTNTATTRYGSAAFSGCRIDKSATGYTLTATSSGLTAATSASFTVTAGPAVRLLFYQSPSSGGLAGSAFATQPLVVILDAQSNLVTSYTTPIALAVTSGTGSAGAVLTCAANPMTPSGGYASFSGCAIDRWGSGYTLTATSGSLPAAASASFDVYQFSPSLQLLNKAGGTAGKAEQGDTIVITYPDPIAPGALCSGWSGAAPLAHVTVSFSVSGGNSISGMTDSADCASGTGFNSGSSGIGTIDMGATSYFSASGSFTGGAASWNSSTNTLTITLGTLSSGTVTTGANSTAVYTANAGLSVPTTISTSKTKQF